MKDKTLIIQGMTVEELLASVRDMVHDEMRSIPQPEKLKPFLTIGEASEFTGLSKPTLYRLTSERKIPHIKRGKLLFNREELTAWLRAGEVKIKKTNTRYPDLPRATNP